jgi:hypothetical protein
MATIGRFSSVILFTLLLEAGVMAQVYETVDDQGNPVFSDTPSQGAKEVELPPENIADAPPPSTRPAEVAPKPQPQPQPDQGAPQRKTGKDQVDEEITRDGAVELMEECQKQRQEQIAPLREDAIEDCVTRRGRDREYCESYNRTFGNERYRPDGTFIAGMFWYLPVCEKAVAAERYFRMNPSSRSYNWQ